MTTLKKVILNQVLHALPFSIQTIYNGHRHGRWPWLSRMGPNGRRTRKLWVDLPVLLDWARARGQKININLEIN